MENLLCIGILYALFYFSRYNMAATMPQIMEHFGWTKSQMGFFETGLPIIYGISVVINGPITDKIGGVKAFLWGAAGVILANAIMGAGSFPDFRRDSNVHSLENRSIRNKRKTAFSLNKSTANTTCSRF